MKTAEVFSGRPNLEQSFEKLGVNYWLPMVNEDYPQKRMHQLQAHPKSRPLNAFQAYTGIERKFNEERIPGIVTSSVSGTAAPGCFNEAFATLKASVELFKIRQGDPEEYSDIVSCINLDELNGHRSAAVKNLSVFRRESEDVFGHTARLGKYLRSALSELILAGDNPYDSPVYYLFRLQEYCPSGDLSGLLLGYPKDVDEEALASYMDHGDIRRVPQPKLFPGSERGDVLSRGYWGNILLRYNGIGIINVALPSLVVAPDDKFHCGGFEFTMEPNPFSHRDSFPLQVDKKYGRYRPKEDVVLDMVTDLLRGHHKGFGATVNEIAAVVNEDEPSILKALDVLIEKGAVERTEEGLFMGIETGAEKNKRFG